MKLKKRQARSILRCLLQDMMIADPVMPTHKSVVWWEGHVCKDVRGQTVTWNSSVFMTLTYPPSFSVPLSLFMYHSLYPPTLPPFTGELSESSGDGIPGCIVLSDCLLPLSVRGVQPHTHTYIHTHTHTHTYTHTHTHTHTHTLTWITHALLTLKLGMVQGWYTNVHKVHKHKHTHTHKHMHTYTCWHEYTPLTLVSNLTHTAESSVRPPSVWSLPTGCLVQLKKTQTKRVCGRYWWKMLIYHFNRL